MSGRLFPSSVAILGSTGSVGRQAVDVALYHGIRVDLLSANRDVAGIEEQARRLTPRFCAMADPHAAEELQNRLSDTPIRVFSGEEGILEAIALSDAETYVNAILGKAGLLPTLAVVDTGKRLALSNKESLVIAGDIVRARARETGCEILPVDSEHSAIFQCLAAGDGEREVKRILLTASGGPFFGYTKEQLSHVTLEDTLKHPTWQMGAKITVDSATLMNKGFEVIEAVRLFGIPASGIQVVVHRESIIHSAVEYIDNTVIAQLSKPDMRACVQYALTYPARAAGNTEALDLFSVGKLTFAPPDPDSFPLLALAFRAVEMGGAMPCVLNGANEVAVAAFLAKKISFHQISLVVEETFLRLSDGQEVNDLEGILTYDRLARQVAESILP